MTKDFGCDVLQLASPDDRVFFLTLGGTLGRSYDQLQLIVTSVFVFFKAETTTQKIGSEKMTNLEFEIARQKHYEKYGEDYMANYNRFVGRIFPDLGGDHDEQTTSIDAGYARLGKIVKTPKAATTASNRTLGKIIDWEAAE